ncbi:MAG TPA: DUF2075 domain-containing protein [Thiotrichales bacterium]|nr:DUF2075 domain-containing protein [Thiotrichales bacterium]
MLEAFYRLGDNPFRMTPDGRNTFHSHAYLHGKTYLRQALREGRGIAVVTGRPGTGKTTLVRDLFFDNDSHQVISNVVTSHLEAEDLLRMMAAGLGLDEDELDPDRLFRRLQKALVRRSKRREREVVLVLDEAQHLTAGAIELISWLVGARQGGAFAFQAVLIGQEPLMELIESREGRLLRDCLNAVYHLDPLTEQETPAYIHHRLRSVGWEGDPEWEEALFPLIYQHSEGIPRRVNLIGGRLLLHGALEEKHRLDAGDGWLVISELLEESLLDPPRRKGGGSGMVYA